MFYENIDSRYRVSLVIGLIIAAVLRRYIMEGMIEKTGLDQSILTGVAGTILDLMITVAMILTVYHLYPLFVKKTK